MNAGQLHHVEIYVSNLARSLEFWGWFLTSLGYEVYQQWPMGCSYKLGATYLVFVQAEDRFLDTPYHRCRVGLNHLAFCARPRKHVDELTAELRKHGITILYLDEHPLA